MEFLTWVIVCIWNFVSLHSFSFIHHHLSLSLHLTTYHTVIYLISIWVCVCWFHNSCLGHTQAKIINNWHLCFELVQIGCEWWTNFFWWWICEFVLISCQCQFIAWIKSFHAMFFCWHRLLIFLKFEHRLVITAVSPNVVIDIVLWLKVEKLGLYKGIHTIIIAVTTINDVLSIFLFNVILGVIFSTGTFFSLALNQFATFMYIFIYILKSNFQLTMATEKKQKWLHYMQCNLYKIHDFWNYFEQGHCSNNYYKVPLGLLSALCLDFYLGSVLVKCCHQKNR